MNRPRDENHARREDDSRTSREGSDDPETITLLNQIPEDRQKVFADLFTGHRDRLRRMVALRLDRRIQRRLDPSDVLQEAYLDASNRLEGYLRDPKVPFFIWLRFLVGQRIHDLHRFHLGARIRDVRREVTLDRGPMPEASSVYMAAQLLAEGLSPVDRAVMTERAAKLEAALDSMKPLDREVLALRHFELLTSVEAAKVLKMRPGSVRSRYLRALKRLNALLSGQPGLGPEDSS